MRDKAGVLMAASVLLFASGCANHLLMEEPPRASAHATAPAPASPAAVPAAIPDTERERLLGIGKKLFLGRCATCHNERGDKPLDSGLPLNARKLTDEVIARNVTGRFAKATDEEKRGVALYIKSFLKN